MASQSRTRGRERSLKPHALARALRRLVEEKIRGYDPVLLGVLYADLVKSKRSCRTRECRNRLEIKAVEDAASVMAGYIARELERRGARCNVNRYSVTCVKDDVIVAVYPYDNLLKIVAFRVDPSGAREHAGSASVKLDSYIQESFYTIMEEVLPEVYKALDAVASHFWGALPGPLRGKVEGLIGEAADALLECMLLGCDSNTKKEVRRKLEEIGWRLLGLLDGVALRAGDYSITIRDKPEYGAITRTVRPATSAWIRSELWRSGGRVFARVPAVVGRGSRAMLVPLDVILTVKLSDGGEALARFIFRFRDYQSLSEAVPVSSG